MRRTLNIFLGVAIAVVAVFFLIGVLSHDEKHKARKVAPKQTVTTKVDSADPGRAPDRPVVAPAPGAVAVGPVTKLADAGGKDETPAGVPAQIIELARQQQDALALTDQLPIVTPLAAPTERGCVSSFVRNYSSRRGVRPRLIVIHWTGSINTPGVGDVNAIVSWFNQDRSQASSTYIVDADGLCSYTVRESDKAWTQALANSVSLSIEVVNSGGPNEGFPYLVRTAGLRKLGQVVGDMARRWQIPLRHGVTSGCRVVSAGIIDHKSLGACGGGHPDIGRYSLDPIITAAKASRAVYPKRITAADRRTCRRLNRYRAAVRAHRKVSAHRIAINVRRRVALQKRGLRCTKAGPR